MECCGGTIERPLTGESGAGVGVRVSVSRQQPSTRRRRAELRAVPGGAGVGTLGPWVRNGRRHSLPRGPEERRPHPAGNPARPRGRPAGWVPDTLRGMWRNEPREEDTELCRTFVCRTCVPHGTYGAKTEGTHYGKHPGRVERFPWQSSVFLLLQRDRAQTEGKTKANLSGCINDWGWKRQHGTSLDGMNGL